MIFLGVRLAAPSFSYQLTKVAVVDYKKVLLAFYRYSSANTEFSREQEKSRKIISDYSAKIQDMVKEQQEAETKGDETRSVRLKDEIERRKNLLEAYVQKKNAQLQTMVGNMKKEMKDIEKLLNIIRYVSENQGFAIVLKKTDPNILWWKDDLDITDKVIEEIKKQSDNP